MNYRKELPDILTSIVADIPLAMTITTQQTDSYTGNILLEVCDLKWSEIGRNVTIDSVEYIIEDIDYDNNIMTVSNADGIPIITTAFDLYAPFFFYGTPIAMTNDLMAIKDSVSKTPLIYLILNYNETTYSDPEDIKDRDADCKLLFLTQANYQEWVTAEFFDRSIKPMSRLRQNFIKQLQDDNRFDMIDKSYGDENQVRFGIYQQNKGVEKNLLQDQLSGNRMDITLTIYKDLSCFEC